MPIISILVNFKGAERGQKFYSTLKQNYGKMPLLNSISWFNDSINSEKMKGKVMIISFITPETRDTIMNVINPIVKTDQFREEVDNLSFLTFDLKEDSIYSTNYLQKKIDYDKQMKRTENRPLVTGKMSISEAVLIAGIMSLVGVSLLALFNPLCAFMGMVSLISYAFIYTPLKRQSNIAVMVGAFPGAMPMVIGCTAAEGGQLTILGLSLFALQFVWQFPHFWAIAWLGDEDYKNAGLLRAIQQ